MKLSKDAATVVANLVAKATPHCEELIEKHNKRLTYLRQSFVVPFVQGINKRKDKEQYKETKIAQEKIFRKLCSYMHYEGNGTINPATDGLNKLDKLMEEVNMVVSYLRYIGYTENLDSVLAKYGMTITSKPLENTYEVLADETTKDNIIKIFEAARSANKSAINEAETVRISIFNELSEEYKYDPKTNKSGIRSFEFERLARLDVAKQKSEEMAEKKFELLKDTVANTIDSKINMQTVAQEVMADSEELPEDDDFEDDSEE